MTAEQERRASFQRQIDDRIASLQQVIAKARERSASCSPCPPARSILIATTPNSSFVSTGGLTIFTIDMDRSSPASSVFEDNENEVHAVGDDNPLSKRPTLSREEEVMAKRVALGVLDSNTGT